MSSAVIESKQLIEICEDVLRKIGKTRSLYRRNWIKNEMKRQAPLYRFLNYLGYLNGREKLPLKNAIYNYRYAKSGRFYGRCNMLYWTTEFVAEKLLGLARISPQVTVDSDDYDRLNTVLLEVK